MTDPTTKIPITDKAAYAAGYRDGSRAALRDVLRDPRWLEELYDPCEDEDAGLIDEHVQRACNDQEPAP
jgi:hypothetical protein